MEDCWRSHCMLTKVWHDWFLYRFHTQQPLSPNASSTVKCTWSVFLKWNMATQYGLLQHWMIRKYVPRTCFFPVEKLCSSESSESSKKASRSSRARSLKTTPYLERKMAKAWYRLPKGHVMKIKCCNYKL